jgi:hypothetical protein
MSGPYDVTWAQWGLIVGPILALGLIVVLVMAWRERRRK